MTTTAKPEAIEYLNTVKTEAVDELTRLTRQLNKRVETGDYYLTDLTPRIQELSENINYFNTAPPTSSTPPLRKDSSPNW